MLYGALLSLLSSFGAFDAGLRRVLEERPGIPSKQQVALMPREVPQNFVTLKDA